MTRPRRSLLLLVRLATRLLPRGEVRERYRREVSAELHDLGPTAQVGHAVRFTCRIWPLRRALSGSGATSVPAAEHAPPWHCRLHLYHHYRLAFTDDGGRYLRCVDCGRDDPHVGARVNDSLAWMTVVYPPN